MTRNIPKIIHQVWSNIEEPLPEFFKELMKTWKEHHPDWEYILWDNDKMNGFIQEFYPEYWIPYNSIKYNIQKWDIIRYFILYHYGGIYADVDYECLESLEQLLKNDKGCYFSPEPAPHVSLSGSKNYFNNALMISVPQHSFMWLVIESVFRELAANKTYPNKTFEVLSTTGPIFLTNLYNDYTDISDIYIIPPELVTPLHPYDVDKYISGNEDPSFTAYIQNKLANALAIHYFMRTWLPDADKRFSYNIIQASGM